MPKAKKRPKMDRYWVSSQKWEISYIANKFNVNPEIVRQARRTCGKSRRKIYAVLRERNDNEF